MINSSFKYMASVLAKNQVLIIFIAYRTFVKLLTLAKRRKYCQLVRPIPTGQ